jgi:hypothetical protein
VILFQIGWPDGRHDEFALAPGLTVRYRDDGVYVPGFADPARDWPCIHPGPLDAWAGRREHPFRIYFDLASLGRGGPGHLLLDVADTFSLFPPCVRVRINDHTSDHQLEPGSGEPALTGDLGAARRQQVLVTFPPDRLRVGRNMIEITSISGCWFLYDAVTLETPPDTRLAETQPTLLVEVCPRPAVVARDGRRQQLVHVQVANFGPELDAEIVAGEHAVTPVRLSTGRQRVAAYTDTVERATPRPITLRAGGKELASHTLTLPPVRPWVVHILPHSHVDIGYTALQADVERRQIENIEKGIDLARRTADYPPGARFRWNTEVLWPVDCYLRNATPEKAEELIDAVRRGWVGLDALYANVLTGLCRPEELLRHVEYAQRLAERCAVPIESAMISDIPGYTWGTLTALAHAGVKYWSIGPNYIDRIGYTLQEWQNRPFYWISPCGQHKVLCWVCYQGYALGHFLRGELTPHVLDILDNVAAADYPYDQLYLRWNIGGDNGPPDERLPDAVREWNATHVYPQLVISTTAEALRALEERYGHRLPTYRGDWTPYWEDGAASTARETALSRQAAERLVQAETLWALVRPEAYPAAELDEAWRNVLLWSEHTWGAWNSVSDPDCEFVRGQWKVKQQFALAADEQSQRLLAAAVAPAAPTAGQVDVYNTGSWPRTDLVLVPAVWSTAGDSVTTLEGKHVPSQRLSTGELAVLVRDVPSFSAQRLIIGPGPATASGAARADATELRSGALALRIDERSGAISTFRDLTRGMEYVAAEAPLALNDYRYLLGSNPADAQRCGPVTIRVQEPGPLVAVLRVESDAPGCRRLTRVVRVVDGLDHMDLVNTVDKRAVREKEGVHFGFGFNVPGGTLRLDIPWAVLEPERDQLPGACKNWLSVGRWADVSNADGGVTWATLDAPLIEIGDLTATLIGMQPDPNAWLRELPASQTIYSWVMNNFWHTNYKADQEGPTVFRYSLRPHRGYDALAAQRFGLERSQPLIVAPAGAQPPLSTRLRVQPNDVLVTALKRSRDGAAWIVRLWNVAAEPRAATLSWSDSTAAVYRSDAREGTLMKLTGPIDLAAGGVVTLRVQ